MINKNKNKKPPDYNDRSKGRGGCVSWIFCVPFSVEGLPSCFLCCEVGVVSVRRSSLS